MVTQGYVLGLPSHDVAVKNTSPAELIKAMRHRLASAISDAKAYDVPNLCARLGLEAGTEQEAFSSKYRYASKRLAALPGTRIVEITRQFLAEEDDFALSEALQLYDENQEPPITELTRKRLIPLLEGHPLCTEMEDLEFLSKLWPIASMPCATDPSDWTYRSFEEAVFQHTVRNGDWSNTDLLKAAGLPTMSRHQVGRFLVALVDPLAQSPERQAQLVAGINELIRHDGYELIEAGRISGSPRYGMGKVGTKNGSPADETISATLAAFSPDDVHARWLAAMSRRASDPRGAITLARTLLEDVCKWILTEAGEAFKDADDLPVLYRKLAKVLKLAPDDHTEQIFKQLLGSCQQVVELLGALRNKLGDAHSSGPMRARPMPRHAELAVNLSGTMATFLVSTWVARQAERV